MSAPNDGGAAFPMPLEWRTTTRSGEEITGVYDNSHDGMSLRDYFAAKAMTEIVSTWVHEGGCSPVDVARDAYRIADAMLAERERAK